MLLATISLLAGFVILIVGGDQLVKGAVSLAQRLGIPPLIIGLTIVAFGTSAPELFVSVQAAIGGQPGLSIGNVVGSNIANVLLVLGVPALISALPSTESGMRRNVLAMLGASVVFILVIQGGILTRFGGAILFALLIAYLVWQYIDSLRADDAEAAAAALEDEVGDTPSGLPGSIVRLVLGIIALPIGAYLAVDGASHIAGQFGVPEEVIGLTIVGIGTSLPELATTFSAAWKGHGAVALGNVVGSNIFNLLLILGVTALIVPVPIAPRITQIDVWVMVATSVLLAGYVFARASIGRISGILFCTGFAAYLAMFAVT